jgi:hypothetical protein
MNKIIASIKVICDYILWFFGLATALFGACLLIEQSALDVFSAKIGLLGPWFGAVSNYLPVLSLLLICISIYIEHIPRAEPVWISRVIGAPIFIFASIVLLGVQISSGHLATKYLDATSFLALGGALLRIRGFQKSIITGPAQS